MPRAIWTGQISFGLVNVPVRLYTAVRSHTVRFHQLHGKTKNRVRQKRVDAQTGEEVEYGDIVKGYEVEDGRYLVVDPDELEQLDPEASRTVDIHDFVDLADIDPIFFDKPYYLAPDGEAARKPYQLLVDAMERTGRVAIATFVMRNKEHLAAIRASDGTLILNTMNYADEVQDTGEIDELDVGDVSVSDREVEMAERLIESLVTGFDPEQYHDRHAERVREFLASKAEGEEIAVAKAAEEPTGEVVDLMAALERSLEGAGGRRRDRATTDGDGYGEMSKQELYDLAQDLDVPGRSNMTKDELISALRDRESAPAEAS